MDNKFPLWSDIPRCLNLERNPGELDDQWIDAFDALSIIEHNLGPDDVILQLAEEAAELAQAAAKYIRARRGENPTPVSVDEAYRKMREEYIDVINCAYVLRLDLDAALYNDGAVDKLRRWADRLKNGCCER